MADMDVRPSGRPEDREGEFIPAAEAQEHGFWGRSVSAYPNEQYTLQEIVKRYPGGPVGTTEEPGQDLPDAGEAEKARKAKFGENGVLREEPKVQKRREAADKT